MKILPAIIMLLVTTSVVMSLSACNKFEVDIVDKRITREEIGAAFQQRDKSLEVLLTRLEALEKNEKDNPSDSKRTNKPK